MRPRPGIGRAARYLRRGDAHRVERHVRRERVRAVHRDRGDRARGRAIPERRRVQSALPGHRRGRQGVRHARR